MSNEESESLSLNLLVEKRKNQVVFAESSQDLVDVIFSFMTLPVGTIVKLVGEQAISCMSNLYASIENLNEIFLNGKICREVLLSPRSASEIYCRTLKVNLHENDGIEYFECKSCSLVSYYYQNGHCRCGKLLEYELKLPSLNTVSQKEGGFVKSTTRFMISDDFCIRPVSTMAGSTLLKMLGEGDNTKLEERTINLGKNKVLELLKLSLVSKIPLTEAFLDSLPLHKSCSNFSDMNNSQGNIDESDQTVTNSTNAEETVSLKLIINSINNTVLYAEAANDFVNLLCSFLTFPIGYLFERNPSLTFKGCMDNIYKSIKDTEVEVFKSTETKETLLESKLAPGLSQHKKVITINEPTKPTYSDLVNRYKAKRCSLDSKSSNGQYTITHGFIEGPSSFMVMDNLAVIPLSSISGLCLIKKLRIPLSKIIEREVVVGEKEAIGLFRASIVSGNALTHAFLRTIDEEDESGSWPKII